MAVNLSLTEALQSVQKMLAEVVTVNDPTNYDKLIGTLNWLFSPSNGKSIQATMVKTANSSKYRPVEIRYLSKKGTGDLVTSDASASCTKTDTRRELIQTLNPTLYVEDKFTIDEEIIREGTMEQLRARLDREIRDAQRNAREDMNRQLFNAYASSFGANPSGNSGAGIGVGAYQDLELILTAGTVSANNFDQITNEMEDNFMRGVVGILGLGNARRYMNRLAVGNIADGGFDVREIASEFGMALFKDHFTTEVLGVANRVLAVNAGISNFFNYNLFKGSDFENPSPLGGVRTTMRDAVFPFDWDFILKYDDECDTGNGLQGAWTGRILTYFDLWQAPDTAFGEPYGDLVDFNGVVGYNITQA